MSENNNSNRPSRKRGDNAPTSVIKTLIWLVVLIVLLCVAAFVVAKIAGFASIGAMLSYVKAHTVGSLLAAPAGLA